MRAVAAAALSAGALGLIACGDDEAAGPGRFDADRAFDDVEAQVAIGPRVSGSSGSEKEVRFIVRALREAGLHEIGVQRPYANVVATIPGDAPGAVVVGAHHDTKDAIPGFVGANDGASGVAILLELARALPSRVDGPSIQLVFFDAEETRGDRPFEEDGTRGSRQFAAYAQRGGEQGSPPLDEIRAMVLFDMVGDCGLQIPREDGSDAALYRLFAKGAEEASGSPQPFVGNSPPVGDDHVPFLVAGIPALDLIDFTYGPGPPPGPYWHTPQDTLDKVCAASLDEVGEAAVRAIPRIR